MTPLPQRWTLLAVLKWVVVCWGFASFATRIWIVASPNEQSQDFVIQIFLPLMVFANGGEEFLIIESRDGDYFGMPVPFGPDIYVFPRLIGGSMIATGLAMMLIAGILVGRVLKKFATPIDPASVN